MLSSRYVRSTQHQLERQKETALLLYKMDMQVLVQSLETLGYSSGTAYMAAETQDLNPRYLTRPRSMEQKQRPLRGSMLSEPSQSGLVSGMA